jgi:hypothetical protein
VGSLTFGAPVVPDHAATVAERGGYSIAQMRRPGERFARSGGAVGGILSQDWCGRWTVRMRQQRDGGEGLPVPREPAEQVETAEPDQPADWAPQTAADRAAARRRLDRLADRWW